MPSSPEVGDALAAEEVVVEDVLFFLALFASAFFLALCSLACFCLAFDVLDVLAPLDALDEAAEDVLLSAPEDVDPRGALAPLDELEPFEPEPFGEPPPCVADGLAGVEGCAGTLGFGLGLDVTVGFGFGGSGGGAATLGGAMPGAAPGPRRNPTTVPGLGV